MFKHGLGSGQVKGNKKQIYPETYNFKL